MRRSRSIGQPLGGVVDIMDVGYTRGFLSTPYAGRISGATLSVDDGVNHGLSRP